MRSLVQWAFRVVAVLAALMTTIQPMLGSFSFFRNSDSVNYETIHLVVGGILYNFVLLLVSLAPFTKYRRRWILFAICLVQYGLTHVQLLLGLESNDDAQMLAYHIPLGVLIFLIAYLTAGLSIGARLDAKHA